MLAGGGLLALLALTTPACGSAPAPPAVDELESQQRLAHRDSDLAAAAAAALTGSAPPTAAPALTQVAAERAAHARVLADEIARAAGKPEPTSTEAPAGTTVGRPDQPTEPPPTLSDVVDALREAADSAGRVATESSGYRAGLLASIAAACTAAHTVALAPEP